MLFSYKGIDSDYKYKRGTVESDSEINAMKSIKEKEDVIVILNLKKVSNIKAINSMRSSVDRQLSILENEINRKTKAYIEKSEKRGKLKKIDRNVKKGASLSEKSPILRGLNKLSSAIKRVNKNSIKSKQVVMDEEMYANLQNMFKEQSSLDNNSSDEVEFQVIKDDLSENKIKKSSRAKKRQRNEGKEIDWSLLDNIDEQSKDNMKIKVKEKEIIMFTRRLHIMLSSGMPLLSSLISLRETSSDTLSHVLGEITEDIQMGSSFSEAISKFPRQFNYTYVALVSIGETSGSLEKSLKDIIAVKEQEQKVAKKIKVASMYPLVIGLVLVVLMSAAFLYFIPSFEAVFLEQGIEMPAFSEFIFGIGRVFPYIFGVMFLLVGTFVLLKKNIPEVNFLYRRYVDKMMLTLPIIKNVTNVSHMFSFSSTIALMLDNGIRLSDTLSLTGKTINNIYIKNEIESISNLMVNGLAFSEAIAEQEYFDEILVNIAMTGEKSGRMVFSLKQVAQYYQDELTRQIDSLLELVQPISILLIGLVLAPIIIAAYLPILEMSSGAGIL